MEKKMKSGIQNTETPSEQSGFDDPDVDFDQIEDIQPEDAAGRCSFGSEGSEMTANRFSFGLDFQDEDSSRKAGRYRRKFVLRSYG